MFSCAMFPRMDTGFYCDAATIAKHIVPSCSTTNEFSAFSFTAAPPPSCIVTSGSDASTCPSFLMLKQLLRRFRLRELDPLGQILQHHVKKLLVEVRRCCKSFSRRVKFNRTLGNTAKWI
jgi:hypothetical protein